MNLKILERENLILNHTMVPAVLVSKEHTMNWNLINLFGITLNLSIDMKNVCKIWDNWRSTIFTGEMLNFWGNL